MYAASQPLASAQPFSGEASLSLPTTGNTPDPIALHMQALNSLSRCKAMLTAREPMYGFALQDLAAAQKAIAALSALVQPLED